MKTKIIALPTEDRTRISDCGSPSLQYSDFGTWNNPELGSCFHLYMLTPDAEISEGDYLFSAYTNRILQADDSGSRRRDGNYAKVISSTDISLGLDLIGEGVCREFCESENRKK